MEYVTYPNGVEIWRVSPCPCAVIRLQWRQIGVLAPLEPFWRQWKFGQISTPFGRKRNGADILRILKMVCASREPRKTFSKVGSRLNGLRHLPWKKEHITDFLRISKQPTWMQEHSTDFLRGNKKILDCFFAQPTWMPCNMTMDLTFEKNIVLTF